IKKAVAALNAVYKGVHRGAGHFVDRTPGILQAHGRFEDEQIVVARVIVIESAPFRWLPGRLSTGRSGCGGKLEQLSSTRFHRPGPAASAVGCGFPEASPPSQR